jgi:hypothetical protein
VSITPDYTRATEVTRDVEAAIVEVFSYKPWDELQEGKGLKVREALMEAVRAIIDNVPVGPDRTAAIRKIREARMDCNSAITHGGKY